ncbi:MAG: hypothetical protein AAGF54_12525, partial [Pseudomonadota bacterium]
APGHDQDKPKRQASRYRCAGAAALACFSLLLSGEMMTQTDPLDFHNISAENDKNEGSSIKAISSVDG